MNFISIFFYDIIKIYYKRERRNYMKVIIGTNNKGKVEGAKKALERYFDNVDIISVTADSEVPDQPVNLEILKGAQNRVKNLKKYCVQNNINVDLYLAIESGIENTLGKWAITNIAVIEDKNDFQSHGISPSFPVPDSLVEEIIETELSAVMDRVFSKDKQSKNAGGGIQLLTHNQVSRIDLTELAFIMALTKYINKDIWN